LRWMALVLFGWDQCTPGDCVLTASSCIWFNFLRVKVQLRLVNATPSPTPSAADAVTGLFTVNTKPVANVAILALSCVHTSGARKPSEERLLVLEGCDTSRRCQGDSRMGSGKTLLPRRGRPNRQSRDGSLNLWHCIASSLVVTTQICCLFHVKASCIAYESLSYVYRLRVIVEDISHLRTSTLPAVGEASCC